jgi:hypothetical protein
VSQHPELVRRTSASLHSSVPRWRRFVVVLAVAALVLLTAYGLGIPD